MAAGLREQPAGRAEISDYTDDIGNAAYNQELSKARASSVHDFLVTEGVVTAIFRFTGLAPMIQSLRMIPKKEEPNIAES
jgi:outer membrane protein OmpA-like peptidoglycan-associated protein